jgi:hypothetical protein
MPVVDLRKEEMVRSGREVEKMLSFGGELWW